MVRINFTTRALYEIDALAEFLSGQSVAYARQFVDSLFVRVTALETLPLLGRIVPELNTPAVRELVHRQYRIIYRVVSDTQLDILSVQSTTRPLRDVA